MKPENIDEEVQKGRMESFSVNESAQAQRRKGAWESAVIATAWLLLSGGVLLFLKFYFQVKGFWGAVLLIAAAMEWIMILPIWVLLKIRLMEIEGGEEDAAAKY